MVEKESLDVVVVCVPNAYHAEATLAALKAAATCFARSRLR